MPRPEPPTAEQTANLQTKFEKTREFKLWRQFGEAIKELSHSSDPRVELPSGFLQLAIRDLENNPFSFPILRRPWNQIVDELELPEDLKKPIPASVWTTGERPRPASAKELDELYRRFETSDEYKLWSEFMAAVRGVDQSGGQTIEVPAGFLRIAFIGFEEDPFSFVALRRAWNQLCDELDLETMKKELYGE